MQAVIEIHRDGAGECEAREADDDSPEDSAPDRTPS